MADYLVTDTELTSIANAIRTKGGTSGTLSFPTGFTTAIGNISTGAANFVQGTFTTGATRASKSTVPISYTGTGYPIALMVFIDGGMYNNSASGNTTWYNSTSNRYDVGAFYMTKSEMTVAPTFSSWGSADYGTITLIYKDSTSSATTYSYKWSQSQFMYGPNDASTNLSCVQFKRYQGELTLAYYIGNKTSSTIGLAPSMKYGYIVVFSS